MGITKNLGIKGVAFWTEIQRLSLSAFSGMSKVKS